MLPPLISVLGLFAALWLQEIHLTTTMAEMVKSTSAARSSAWAGRSRRARRRSQQHRRRRRRENPLRSLQQHRRNLMRTKMACAMRPTKSTTPGWRPWGPAGCDDDYVLRPLCIDSPVFTAEDKRVDQLAIV
jgi:hypothetical protein